MNIPREFIELLLARIDVVDFINTHIPLRKKSGSNYFARCPFHNENSASFSVSQPKQFYYCFGCGAHGNAIDFIIQHDRLTFPEAVEVLARHVGMEIPREAGAIKKNETLPILYELTAKAADYYYEQMCKSQRAIDYLKQRGISGSIAKQFQLGYALPGWSHLLDLLGKAEEDRKLLAEAGLVIKKNEGGYYDRFRDRIMFPIHDYRGRLIGFGGRILDQGEPKYLNSPETPLFQKGHELYGLYQAQKSTRKLERIILVEGYMDVIALFQEGITYAVATLGTATTVNHIERLLRYTSEIVFCFDGDQAGRTAAWRALQVIFPIMQDSLQVRFLFLPDGEDPDSLVRKEGKAVFEKRLETALSLSNFFFQTLSRQSDMSTIEGRARFAAASLGFIKQLPPGILQGILVDELSKRARVDLSELKQQIKNTEVEPAAFISALKEKEETKGKVPAPLRLALTLIVQQPSLIHEILETLPPSNLPGYDFLLRLIEIIKQHAYVTTGGLIEYFRNQKEAAAIAKLAQHQHLIPETGIKSEFLGAMRQLTIVGLNAEIDRFLAKAAQESLSEQEKLELSTWIAKKKALIG